MNNIVAMPQSVGAKVFSDINYKARLKKYVKKTDKLFRYKPDNYGKNALYKNEILSAIKYNDVDNIDRMRIVYTMHAINRIDIAKEVKNNINDNIPYSNDTLQNYASYYIYCILTDAICSQKDKCIVDNFTYTRSDGTEKTIKKGAKISKVIQMMIKDNILKKDINVSLLYAQKQYFLVTNVIADVFRQSAIITDNNNAAFTSCHCYYNGWHAAGALSTALTDNCYCLFLLTSNPDINRLFYDLDYLPAIGRMSLLVNDTMIVYNNIVYGTNSIVFESIIETFAKEYFDSEIEYTEEYNNTIIRYTDENIPYDDFSRECIVIRPKNNAGFKKVKYGIDLYDNNGDMIDDASKWIASENMVSCVHCGGLLDTDYDDICTDDDGYHYCTTCFDNLFTYCNCERLVKRDDIIIIEPVNAYGAMYYCNHCVPQCNVCNNDDATHYIELNNGNILVCDDCLWRMQTNCIVCNEPVVRHHRAIGYHHHHNHGAMPVHVHTHCVNGLANVLIDVSRSGNLIQ